MESSGNLGRLRQLGFQGFLEVRASCGMQDNDKHGPSFAGAKLEGVRVLTFMETKIPRSQAMQRRHRE
jgi:hypothetical protein